MIDPEKSLGFCKNCFIFSPQNKEQLEVKSIKDPGYYHDAWLETDILTFPY